MKKLKKYLGFVMAALMAFALTPTAAFAATQEELADKFGKSTLTMENAAEGHTYSVYQLLVGSWSDGKLVNAEAGVNLNTDEAGTDLEKFFTEHIANNVDAALGAEMAKFYTGTPVHQFKSNGTVDLVNGYYIIVDSTDPDKVDDALSRYIVDIVGNTTIRPKASTPTLDKNIVNGEGVNQPVDDGKNNTAAIGDTIEYELKGKLPNPDGYSKYTYKISDKMSEGLTLNEDSFAVTVGTSEGAVALDDSYFKIDVAEDKHSFTVTVDVIAMRAAGDVYAPDTDFVFVNYSAVVNENAAIGNESNDNNAKLTFSNNPMKETTNETEEITTHTYVTELNLFKYHMVDGDRSPLAGAVFELTGTNLNKVVVTIGADGTPTLTEKDADNAAIRAEVGADGVLKFTGLNKGSYTLKEVVVPDGYNAINDMTFTVSFENNTWSVDGAGFTADNGVISVDVENKSGLTLPSTGGIGTTLFYVGGAVLIIGCVAFLITRRRAGSAK